MTIMKLVISFVLKDKGGSFMMIDEEEFI